MIHKFLVVIPSASGLTPRTLSGWRGQRNTHCTTRIKELHDRTGQLGVKLRTRDVKGSDPDWKQAYVIPFACPSKPHDVVLEVNVRDAPSGLRFWNKQMGSIRVPVADISDGQREYKQFKNSHNDFKISLNSKWCDDEACVKQFQKEAGAASYPTIQHDEGMECGSSCHMALDAAREKVVEQAMRYLREAKSQAQAEDRADDRGDEAEDALERMPSLVTNTTEEARLQQQENDFDRLEDRAEEAKESAWDNMRVKLAKIGNLLKNTCAGDMPEIPFVCRHGNCRLYGYEKIAKDYKKKQVSAIENYLESLNRELKQLHSCLHRNWFVGQLYGLERGDTCPQERPAVEYFKFSNKVSSSISS